MPRISERLPRRGEIELCSLLMLLSLALSNGAIAQEHEGAAGAGPDLTWVEKYVTYRQDHAGQLHLTDVHFLAELVYDASDDIHGIEGQLLGDNGLVATYSEKDKRAFTNGFFYTRKTRSFASIDAVESAWPATTQFQWELHYPDKVVKLDPIHIGGGEQRTQIPAPSTLRLSQQGEPAGDLDALDPGAEITIEWDPFVGGATLGDSPWSDFIFVLVSDCHGEVVFTGGAPGTDEEFVTYRDTSVAMPAGLLKPGQDYTFFISQVNTVDYNVSHGIEQLAANSFATELPVATRGEAVEFDCPVPAKPAVYQWTRKTAPGKMEAWPTLRDHW